MDPFKPLADFDWKWPTHCDRAIVEELMTLAFLDDASNIVLVGPNGVGKTMCACNLGYQALLAGRTALFITAAQLLGELASLDSDSALRRRLRHYAVPDLLMIDEVGYLSYSNRHADPLLELISRRYQHKSTVVTTNKPFANGPERAHDDGRSEQCDRAPDAEALEPHPGHHYSSNYPARLAGAAGRRTFRAQVEVPDRLRLAAHRVWTRLAQAITSGRKASADNKQPFPGCSMWPTHPNQFFFEQTSFEP